LQETAEQGRERLVPMLIRRRPDSVVQRPDPRCRRTAPQPLVVRAVSV